MDIGSNWKMKISQLKTKSNNPRKIDEPQIQKLMQSIKDFPKMMELRPIVYDPVTMEVLGGNQRLTACKKLGMKELPDAWVRSADSLTEDEKRRFVIQDNHQSGDWDFEILNAEWGDIDLAEMGIELPELDILEEIPQDLMASNRDKKPTLTVTFTSDKELISAEIEIGELLKDKYPNANWSVSSGEI